MRKSRLLLGVALVALSVVALRLARPARAGGGFDKGSCTFNGKKLYGKIQVVAAFPDVKVQVVTAFPALKVQEVKALPDKCGMWQLVTSFPNTKVQYVTAFPDVKIQRVTAFPGAQ